MTGRDKFIVVALIGLMVVASVAAIAADQNPQGGDPAYGGTYVEGVVGVPQYLNPVIAATDVDEDVSRLAFTGLGKGNVRPAGVLATGAPFRLPVPDREDVQHPWCARHTTSQRPRTSGRPVRRLLVVVRAVRLHVRQRPDLLPLVLVC